MSVRVCGGGVEGGGGGRTDQLLEAAEGQATATRDKLQQASSLLIVPRAENLT